MVSERTEVCAAPACAHITVQCRTAGTAGHVVWHFTVHHGFMAALLGRNQRQQHVPGSRLDGQEEPLLAEVRALRFHARAELGAFHLRKRGPCLNVQDTAALSSTVLMMLGVLRVCGLCSLNVTHGRQVLHHQHTTANRHSQHASARCFGYENVTGPALSALDELYHDTSLSDRNTNSYHNPCYGYGQRILAGRVLP